MMGANGGAPGHTMSLSLGGNLGVPSTVAKPLNPTSAYATSQGAAAGVPPGISYPGGYVAGRPATGFLYPPYSVVKQFAPWRPQVSGVIQGQTPPLQEHEHMTSSTRVPVPIPEGHGASAAGLVWGAQSVSHPTPTPDNKKEVHHRSRHRRGDSHAPVSPNPGAQPSSGGKHNNGGGHREQRRRHHEPPVDGSSSTRAPSPATATVFGGVFPDMSNDPNAHASLTESMAAGTGADDAGRRRRRHRRGDDRGEGRRDASRSSTPRRQTSEDAGGRERRGHRHRSGSRRNRDKPRSETSRSKSASPHGASDPVNRLHHPHVHNYPTHSWDTVKDTTAVNSAISAGSGVVSPSLGSIPVTAVGPSASPSVAGNVPPVLVPPSLPVGAAVASSIQNALPTPPLLSLTAPSPSPAAQPRNTSKNHRRHRNRRSNREHRRARSVSASSSSRDDTESSLGSSSYSLTLSSSSASTSRPASVPLRDRRRRSRKNGRGRRSSRHSLRAASQSSKGHPTSAGLPVGAPSPPTDHNTGVPKVPKKKGLGGILGFFRRRKSSAKKPSTTDVSYSGVPAQQTIIPTPVMMPRQVLYHSPTGLSGASALPWGMENGAKPRRPDGYFDLQRNYPPDISHSNSHLFRWGNDVAGGPIFLRQSNDNNNARIDHPFPSPPSTKKKGFFGGLFRKKKDKAGVSVNHAAVVTATYPGNVAGWPSFPSYPASAGTPVNLDANRAAIGRFPNPPASQALAPPGGDNRGGSAYAPPAANAAPITKPGLFERLIKKIRKSSDGPPQEGLPPEVVHQVHVQQEARPMRRERYRRSSGHRERRRHINHGPSSSVREHVGRKARRHTSGNRDVSSHGHG